MTCPKDADDVEKAELLARFVHYGQTRHNGEPYITHCLRVAHYLDQHGSSAEIVITALLHDCIEDGKAPITSQILISCFGNKIYRNVSVLSYLKGTSYLDYIAVILNYPDLTQIKIADLIDNTADKLSDKQFQKYKEAVLFMQSKGVVIPNILLKRFV